MDMFSSDSNFYEIGTSDDLKALWDADLDADPLLGSFRSGLYEADEWSLAEAMECKSQVVIHDRLMSDAALATAPIKTEHSYSYPMPDSPCSLAGKMDSDEDDDDDNMDSDSFQGPSMSTNAPEKGRSIADMLVIKEEPLSDTESVDSYSMSPESPSSSTTFTSIPKNCRQQEQQSILKKSAVYFNTSNTIVAHGRPLILPKLEIKVEPTTTGFSLPPTPPSSTSSDNEGGVSPDVDTRLRHYRKQSTARVYLSTGSRQPIQSPLISTQMKGITGTLMLTDEEKRTLVAEGYPIPTRLPLSKAEEKALKKIRRKIKNKISAQESRRKKKEYMDSLEKKVEVLTSENSDFKKKIESLEDSNATMLRELKKLQAIVTKDLVGSSSRTMNVPQYIAAKKDLSSRPSRS